MSEPVVVDASVLIELLTQESRRAELSLRRLTGVQLHVPEHLPAEVMNVVRRMRNAGLVHPRLADDAMTGFWDMALTRWPLEWTSGRAWQLGASLSSYDAAYVALAELLEAPLVTLDARIARAPGIRCVVEVVR